MSDKGNGKRGHDSTEYIAPKKKFCSNSWMNKSQSGNKASPAKGFSGGSGFVSKVIITIDSVETNQKMGDTKTIKGNFWIVDPVSKGQIRVPKDDKDFKFVTSEDGSHIDAICKVARFVPLKTKNPSRPMQNNEKEMVLDEDGHNLLVKTSLRPNLSFGFMANSQTKVVTYPMRMPFSAEAVISLSASKDKKKKRVDEKVPENAPPGEQDKDKPAEDKGERVKSTDEEVVYINYKLTNIVVSNTGNYAESADKLADFFSSMEKAIIATHTSGFLFDKDSVEEISAARGHFALRLSGDQISPPKSMTDDGNVMVYPGQFVQSFYPAEEPKQPERAEDKNPVFPVDLDTRIVVPYVADGSPGYIKKLIKFKFDTLSWTQDAMFTSLGIDNTDKDITGTFLKSVIYYEALAEVAPSRSYVQEAEEGFDTVYAVTPYKFFLNEKSVEPFSFPLSKETFLDVFTQKNNRTHVKTIADNPLFALTVNCSEAHIKEKLLDSVLRCNNIVCLNSLKENFLPHAVNPLHREKFEFIVTPPPWLVSRATTHAVEEEGFQVNREETPIDNLLAALGLKEEFASVVENEAKRLDDSVAQVVLEKPKKSSSKSEQKISVQKKVSPYVDFFDTLMKKLNKFSEDDDKIEPKMLIWAVRGVTEEDAHTSAAESFVSSDDVPTITLGTDVHDPEDDYEPKKASETKQVEDEVPAYDAVVADAEGDGKEEEKEVEQDEPANDSEPEVDEE